MKHNAYVSPHCHHLQHRECQRQRCEYCSILCGCPCHLGDGLADNTELTDLGASDLTVFVIGMAVTLADTVTPDEANVQLVIRVLSNILKAVDTGRYTASITHLEQAHDLLKDPGADRI